MPDAPREQDTLHVEHWHVDVPLAGSSDDAHGGTSAVDAPRIHLQLAPPSRSTQHAAGLAKHTVITTELDQLRVLVYELKQAREAIRQIAEP